MKGWELLVRFFWGLVPQKDDDALKLYEWRWKSIGLGLAGLVIGIYAANWLPFAPSPYALAETVDLNKQDIQRQLNSMSGQVADLRGKVTVVISQQRDSQEHAMNNDLIDARRYQCRAVNSADHSALPFWNNRVQILKLQYQQLTGNSWPDMDCNSF